MVGTVETVPLRPRNFKLRHYPLLQAVACLLIGSGRGAHMISVALGLAATISVLAFGGTTVLRFVTAEIIVAVAACLQFHKVGWPALPRRATLILLIFIAVPLMQLIHMPEQLLNLLSPGRSKLAREFALSGVDLDLSPTISLVRYETLLGLLSLCCYLLVFVLAYQNGEARTGRRFLSRSLIGLGLIEAVYGLMQYLAGWQYIYIYPKETGLANATGTYINYNHFAGLLEMVLPFLLVQLRLEPAIRNSQRRSGWKEFLSGPDFGRWMLRLGLFVVVFLALIFSRSRSGIVAGTVGMILAASLALPRSRGLLSVLPGVAVAVLLLSYSLWIGISPVIGRFESVSKWTGVEQGRAIIWKDTLSLIRDFPVLGSGLGTYTSVSMHYQTAPGTVRYEHAHNDYLEFAADMGLPAALLLFGSLWWLAWKTAGKSLTLARSSEKRLAAACAGAMIALLVHSLTDFNLQIPANALIFSWIAGTAMALLTTPAR